MIAPRYVGPSTTHEVAAVEEGLADELERLDRAARDQQLVVRRPPALERLEPARERVERAGEPARRRVLEGRRLARGRELREQRSGTFARKRQRVGKPPANEMRSGTPRSARIPAIPSPTSARVRAAKSRCQRRVSGVTAIDRL